VGRKRVILGRRKRRHHQAAFAADAQRGSTGHQQRQMRAVCQQRGDERRRFEHVLEVVENQEQVLVAQVLDQLLVDGAQASVAQAQRAGNRHRHQAVVT
jgi:hypothetical protein